MNEPSNLLSDNAARPLGVCWPSRLLASAAISIAIAGCANMDAKNAGGDVDVAVLGAPEAVKPACSRLRQVGITCVMPGTAIAPEDLVVGAIPLTNADYSFLDQQSRPAVRGMLVLSNAVSPGGNQYFHAYAKVFKYGFMGIQRPVKTSSYNRQFWREVGRTIPIAPAGNEKEAAFAADMDRQIQVARDTAKREADAQIAQEAKRTAEAAYRASAEYKNAQAKKAVDACRRQIAYARSLIARNDRVARISGYENIRLRESAASAIVQCEDTIARGGY